MAIGYFDVQSPQDIVSIATRVAAISNGVVGCVPTDVLVLGGGRIRTLFAVDEADSVAVFSTGTIRVYASKIHYKNVLWNGTLPSVRHAAISRALHLTEFLQAVSDLVWAGSYRSAWSRLPNTVLNKLDRLVSKATRGDDDRLPGRTRYYMHEDEEVAFNEADAQRLWRVAFLGALSDLFEGPEAIWYSGPSPSELRCHALSGGVVACH
tara:strand:- start:848 stop:1474 length:627 start_codon:yes stop_codon:yes gene_type:complete